MKKTQTKSSLQKQKHKQFIDQATRDLKNKYFGYMERQRIEPGLRHFTTPEAVVLPAELKKRIQQLEIALKSRIGAERAIRAYDAKKDVYLAQTYYNKLLAALGSKGAFNNKEVPFFLKSWLAEKGTYLGLSEREVLEFSKSRILAKVAPKIKSFAELRFLSPQAKLMEHELLLWLKQKLVREKARKRK